MMYDNWPSVVRNLRNSCRKCAQLSRVLGQEGADAQTLGRFYVIVVHKNLLFGLETWVVTPLMVQTLGGVPPFRGQEPHREYPMTLHIQKGFGLPPPSGRCPEGGGSRGDYGAHCVETQYFHILHCYAVDYEAILGGDSMARGAGGELVVGEGGVVPNGIMGSSREGKDGWANGGATYVPEQTQMV